MAALYFGTTSETRFDSGLGNWHGNLDVSGRDMR